MFDATSADQRFFDEPDYERATLQAFRRVLTLTLLALGACATAAVVVMIRAAPSEVPAVLIGP